VVASACVFAWQVTRFCIPVGGIVAAHVSCRTVLADVVKALEGSIPFYSFESADGLYVATGFVIVPLPVEFDEFTLLEATGCASTTKDGAEEAAASALIQAASRDFGVVVTNSNFSDVEDSGCRWWFVQEVHRDTRSWSCCLGRGECLDGHSCSGRIVLRAHG